MGSANNPLSYDLFKVRPFHCQPQKEFINTQYGGASENLFEIVLIYKGLGWNILKREKFSIFAPYALCVTPGQSNLVKAQEEMEGIIVSFNDSFLYNRGQDGDFFYQTRIIERLAKAGGITLPDFQMEEVKQIILKMRKEYEEAGLLRDELLSAYLRVLLIHLSRQIANLSPEINAPKRSPFLDRFLWLLEKHYKTVKTVNEYAALLSVTPGTLNTKIKLATGHSVSHHIRERVLLEAKRRAVNTDGAMKEVANHLGFPDDSHFSRYFKKSIGVSFSDFRKEIKYNN